MSERRKGKRTRRTAAARWRALTPRQRRHVVETMKIDRDEWVEEYLEEDFPGENKQNASAWRAALAVLRDAAKVPR